MKTPHTACRRGKWVYVRLRSGETFRDQFVERTPSKWVVFRRHVGVRAAEITSFMFRDPRRVK